MGPRTAYVIGIVLALIGTVLTFIFIMPESKKAGLNKSLSVLRDIFSFKELFLEKLLRACYIFLTLFCIFGGFFMLFARSYFVMYIGSSSLAMYGLMLMILGPIVVRICFEISMMFVLLVKNTMDINSKIGSCGKAEPVKAQENNQVQPKMVYCTKCGTRYDANQGGCPSCAE